MDIEMLSEDNFAPSPSRLVEGLRDTGYSYEAAFADIVDNSIAANATKIDIQIYRMIDGKLRVVITDNGEGMDLPTLLNAMRYGSPKRDSPKSLGKFGMGLKTASTAFCRKLTVFSSQNGSVEGRCWDINEIVEHDQWILITPNPSEYEEEIEIIKTLSENNSGTVVIWEDIDRLLSHLKTTEINKVLAKLIVEIKSHLSSVFGKFLDDSNQDNTNVELRINDEVVIGWDPTGKWLNNDEEKKVSIHKKVLDVTLDDDAEVERTFELNGYILPNKSLMTDSDREKLRYGNDNQGFYIYREGRLIYGGGWPHRIFTKEPHLNLLRVELNFNHELDDYFQVDIRKTRIIFPQDLRDKIKRHLAPYRNEANKRYRIGNVINTEKKEGTDRRGSDIAIKKHQEENAHATVSITDASNGEISVSNQFGDVTLTHAQLVEGTEISVKPVDMLRDGCLWEYGIDEDGEICVLLNESHEFYKKFYSQNFDNPVLIQSMDCLFWSLANAEIGSVSVKSRRNIEELRFLVSKDLRLLSEELPDVDE